MSSINHAALGANLSLLKKFKNQILMYTQVFKRLLDLILGILALVVLLPIVAGVWLILMITNQGKPFFFQDRPGKNGIIFKIIKFKTMTDRKGPEGHLLPYEKRVTPIGLWLRKYSLDEIPQLINVVIGDMSIVGPRPLLPKYLPLYNATQRKRHNVRPGITGWAQVKGRNTLSWEQKFEFDVWYVEHMSFFLDLKIMLLTLKRVVIPQGINSGETINMPDFTGTKHD